MIAALGLALRSAPTVFFPSEPSCDKRASVATRTTTLGLSEDGGGAERPLVPCVSVVHHPQPAAVGLRVLLEPGVPVRLGRGQSTFGPGVLDDARISRSHTVICADGDLVTLRDEGSHNGTFVNGERVMQAALSPHDVIGIGSIVLMYHRAPAVYRVRRHDRIVGVSHHVARVLEQIESVAPHPTAVLVLGESGTGKELVAQEIHARSGRDGGFFPINCGGVNDGILQSELFGCVKGAYSGADRDRAGLVEAADGGTLFLDEIGDASEALQRSLLRVLQEGAVRRIGATRDVKVDTRFVAATHRDLGAMAAEGAFREDLYARLTGWVIRIAPLRERKEDVPHLVAHMMERRGAGERRLHHSFAARLLRYDFPRNVRELEKIVERALIECSDTPMRITPSIEAMLASAPPSGPVSSPEPSDEVVSSRGRRARPDEATLRRLLLESDGNVTRLASRLGIGRNTLYRWIREAAIDLDDLRA